jgi:hypothetical protein
MVNNVHVETKVNQVAECLEQSLGALAIARNRRNRAASVRYHTGVSTTN